MNRTVEQSDPAPCHARLRERLKAVGACIVRLHRHGTVEPVEVTRDLAHALLTADVFGEAIREQWARLSDAAANPVTLWPGLLIMPLTARRQRQVGNTHRETTLIAAVLITHDILLLDQLPAVYNRLPDDACQLLRSTRAVDLLREEDLERTTTMIRWMQEDTHEIDRRCQEIHTMSQQLLDSYEELSLLYRFTTSMTVDQQPGEFLSDACRELQSVLGFKWMALHLVEDDIRLGGLTGQTYIAGDCERDQAVLQRIGRILLLQRSMGGGPAVIEDTRTLNIPHLHEMTRQLMVIPLVQNMRPIGILFAGDKTEGGHISSVDAKLAGSLAGSLSIYLENVILYEESQELFIGTLHALTSSIDAKDSYTHGHSERVALLSRELARACGLDEHTIERVYLAGLVHDVGKIGVPEHVLSKPGPLTPDEFALIRAHPEIGARILQDIRQMRDLIPGVLYHHERWDGRGYPQGLRDREIPLFGRLIALADSFDAMNSNRAYRSSMGAERVLLEIMRCAGTQFDPDLAEAFCRMDFTSFERLLLKHEKEHQMRRSA